MDRKKGMIRKLPKIREIGGDYSNFCLNKSLLEIRLTGKQWNGIPF